MSKSDLNGERSQCRNSGQSYCCATHREAGIPVCRTEMVKLKAHGTGNDVINWIEKWLTHRRQRVTVDGEISNWKSVLNGVPQGSVLGPILFLIYVNYLEDDISSKILKFADDTKSI